MLSSSVYVYVGVNADDLVYIRSMEGYKVTYFNRLAGKSYRFPALQYIRILMQVICVAIVADGATSNRKFFTMHTIEEHQKSSVTYKAPNIFLPGNFVYFMCDVPHLLKTVRNAWSNSRHNGTRHLEVKNCAYYNISIIH